MHDILDALGEACLDLDVNLHADRLRRLGVNLEPPDKDLWFVCGRAHEELVALVALLSHDHRRRVHQFEDLGDALLTARVGVEYLLDRRSFIIWINVPNFELAVECADQQVVLVDLVEEGWVLMVVNLVLDGLRPCLDVDVADENLLVFEA